MEDLYDWSGQTKDFCEEMHKAIMYNQMHGWLISFHIISALTKDEGNVSFLITVLLETRGAVMLYIGIIG